MLVLETTLKLDKIVNETNIAPLLSKQDLINIGKQVVQLYDLDENTREEWKQRKEQQFKLALQVADKKNFPWTGASNIKFPLITIAALQYHARAYPALIDGANAVHCRVVGDDKDGQQELRARRIERHMSFQLLESDSNWEEDQDKVLLTQPIVGSAFKKTYFDPNIGEPVSENVLAKDLVVSYFTKDLATCPRITHVLYRSQNDIYERVKAGIYLEHEDKKATKHIDTRLQGLQDHVHGLTAPTDDPSATVEMLEQHCYMDLDDDGYEEPYIVTVGKVNKKVYRIVARFYENNILRNKKGEVLRIEPEQYFTKYPFIPSPDGGFYDLGFGDLLGPLNDSINTIINQLVDAGTMANTAGGFLSRGIKIRGGNYNFAPLEWKHVESTGDDLRKGIVPLPVREPSQVLFTLLSLLIDYGERIGGSVDVLAGKNPGQNTPAETSRNMTEQGLKIFNGIFKRTYRAMKEEFRKIYRINQLNITQDIKLGGQLFISKDDYAGDHKDIVPSADPNMSSESQRINQAIAIKQSAMSTPGYDRYQVEMAYLRALKVTNAELLYPDPKGPNAIPAGPDPKMLEIQVKQQKLELEKQQMQLDAQMQQGKMMMEAELIKSQIMELQAKATKAMAEAQGVDSGHQISLINAELSLMKGKHEGLMRAAEFLHQRTKDHRELDVWEKEIEAKKVKDMAVKGA